MADRECAARNGRCVIIAMPGHRCAALRRERFIWLEVETTGSPRMAPTFTRLNALDRLRRAARCIVRLSSCGSRAGCCDAGDRGGKAISDAQPATRTRVLNSITSMSGRRGRHVDESGSGVRTRRRHIRLPPRHVPRSSGDAERLGVIEGCLERVASHRASVTDPNSEIVTLRLRPRTSAGAARHQYARRGSDARISAACEFRRRLRADAVQHGGADENVLVEELETVARFHAPRRSICCSIWLKSAIASRRRRQTKVLFEFDERASGSGPLPSAERCGVGDAIPEIVDMHNVLPGRRDSRYGRRRCDRLTKSPRGDVLPVGDVNTIPLRLKSSRNFWSPKSTS